MLLVTGPVTRNMELALVKAYRATMTEASDLEGLIADPTTDAEMRNMAEGEKSQIAARHGDGGIGMGCAGAAQ